MPKRAGQRLLQLIFAGCASYAPEAWAAHPLNTDDAGVLGAGNFQLETTYDSSHDKEDGVRARIDNFSVALSYGLSGTIDLVLSAPYFWTESRSSVFPASQTEHGIGDAVLQLKWKFYERDRASFALKPGMSFTTGDEERELGAGKNTYGMLLISSLEYDPRSYHFNLGYTRNNNLDIAAIRNNLFLASAALTYDLGDQTVLVGEAGWVTNADRRSGSHPGYVLLGLVYALREYIDLDAGVQVGLNEVSEDRIYRAGLTIRW
jgi:hypothetical protein